MRNISTRFTGLLLVALGVWGGLVPFVGHYFHFALGPDKAWTWTAARLYLDVLPGAATVLGGLILMDAGPRASARVGALFALAGGLWFAIGPEISQLWHTGGAQGAGHGSAHVQMLEMLTYHTGLGAVITALAGYALPRFSARDEVVAPGRGRVAVAGAAAGAGAAATTERGDRWYHQPGALDEPVSQRDREAAQNGDAAAEAEPSMSHEPAPIRENEPTGDHEPVGEGERVEEPASAGDAGTQGAAQDTGETRVHDGAASAGEPVTQGATTASAPAPSASAGTRTATADRPTVRRRGGLLGGLLRR